MSFALWSTLAGALLIVMALAGSVLRRAAFSGPIVYLAVGAALSPWWLDVLRLDVIEHARWIEPLAEVVVLISLFTAGLKMSSRPSDPRWTLPLRLATLSMITTVGLVTLLGTFWLGLPLGAAVLLGAILAPTDPVLASDVQVGHPGDRDRLRFALTGEGGLNDGTAFPFVLLGLGLLGAHELGTGGWRWWVVDVAWATTAGLASGVLLGTAVGALVLYLRKVHKEAVGLDNFIALGLTALTYGVTLQLHAYGFLAVFAAGFAFRRVERREAVRWVGTESRPPELPATGLEDEYERGELATQSHKAGAFMAQATLSFNEQIERIGEVSVVVVMGALLWAVDADTPARLFVAVLLLAVRPLAVLVGLAGSRSSRLQRGLMGWFGIRGIGSIYYLAYAINHGLQAELAHELATLTLTCVVGSVLLHGVSVTPLMRLYERLNRQRGARGL